MSTIFLGGELELRWVTDFLYVTNIFSYEIVVIFSVEKLSYDSYPTEGPDSELVTRTQIMGMDK